MNHINNIADKMIRGFMAIGAVFIVGMLALIVANVFFRLFGAVITGSYEISELMIVVGASFAIAYAAIEKRHVSINILISRLSPRSRTIAEIITSVFCIVIWVTSVYAGVVVIGHKWLIEKTETLYIPVLPFRIIWVLGLSLLSLAYVLDIFRLIKQGTKK